MSTPTQFADVFFEFVSAAHGPLTGRGTVIVRDDAMVLEIDSTGTTYHLLGRPCEHHFVARSSDVLAQWASIGDAYIGKWVEDGEVWVFYFNLPRQPRVTSKPPQ